MRAPRRPASLEGKQDPMIAQRYSSWTRFKEHIAEQVVAVWVGVVSLRHPVTIIDAMAGCGWLFPLGEPALEGSALRFWELLHEKVPNNSRLILIDKDGPAFYRLKHYLSGLAEPRPRLLAGNSARLLRPVAHKAAGSRLVYLDALSIPTWIGQIDDADVLLHFGAGLAKRCQGIKLPDVLKLNRHWLITPSQMHKPQEWAFALGTVRPLSAAALTKLEHIAGFVPAKSSEGRVVVQTLSTTHSASAKRRRRRREMAAPGS